ncbi:diguanylate cyclase domain-containing protein [Neptuniibacter sp. QD37_11]|uniref:diguanylate cyclase domain-containing protein n=1 Tax=Neptuniibacter sp. QD37_11 TaxID=3398209 RepID=UPI0039F589C6
MKYKTKIILAVIVLGLAFLAALSALTLNLLRTTATAEVEQRVQIVNTFLGITLLPELNTDHRDGLGVKVNELMQTRSLAYLQIYDQNGSSIISIGGHNMPHTHGLAVLWGDGGDMINQQLLLRGANGSSYEIHYGLPAEQTNFLVQGASYQVLGLALFEILLMVIGAHLALRVISKQLSHLREASSHIAAGNFNYRVSEESCGELIETAQAFNIMGARLEKYEKDKTSENLHLKELSQAVEQSPVAVVMTDSDGVITYANPCFYQTSGYSEDEVIGKNPRLLQSGETEKEDYIDLWQTITSGQTWKGELCNRRKDGSVYWDKTSISPVSSENGEVTHYISVKEDVTAYKQIEERMRVATTVFDAASEAIMVTDLNGAITMVNPAFYEITGYQSKEVLGQSPRVLNSGHHDESFYKSMFEELQKNNRWEGEIWNRRKSGEVYPQWQTIAMVRDEDGEPLEYIALFTDISKRKEQEDEIRFRANYDALTRLPNRSLFNERLTQALVQAKREGAILALLYLDLDGFKEINDTHGHLAGDKALQHISQRLTECIRESDCVARLGGDEFVIFLSGLEFKYDAEVVAKKIIDSVQQPFAYNGVNLKMGVSIGISIYPDDHLPEKLFEHADSAMYEAKRAGKNTFRYFSIDFD